MAARSGAARLWRVTATVVAIVCVEAVVCGLALLPVLAFWSADWWKPSAAGPRLVTTAFLVVPSYVTFTLALMLISPLAARLTRAYTPANLELRIADMDWALMRWARYMVAIHMVRMFAGTLFRGSPLWTWYLRWNGARLGRGVYINSLAITDHNLLDFGDDVIVGEAVHISGHTVERGVLKTGPVSLGPNVTVGLGSVVGIGVTAGPGSQIAAMSLVPKYSTLKAGVLYAGVPARPLDN
jgi:serine acetyltransferase